MDITSSITIFVVESHRLLILLHSSVIRYLLSSNSFVRSWCNLDSMDILSFILSGYILIIPLTKYFSHKDFIGLGWMI